MNPTVVKKDQLEGVSYPVPDLDRRQPCLQIERGGVKDRADAEDDGRRMSRRKKAKVEYREMEEKYSQLLDEEDVSDASEKSKAGGTATPEKKLTSIPELLKKETSLPTEMPPANTVAPPVSTVKPEKDEEVEPDSEQDDPTGCDVTSPKSVDRTTVGNLKKDTLKTNKETAQACSLPRVRGLCNLGNTCFFNAVLQCLAWTPFLLPVLQEMSESGTKFQLPGQLSKEVELPLLEGELGKWGSLTEILASTLMELQSSSCHGVFNPTHLLNKLIQRFPEFGGGEQHDSHELLRHLLEGVRTEDLERYQSAILYLLGLSEKSDPSEVEDKVHAKVKAYGRQAAQMMLYPDQVFRGFLVSTLQCQDCLHTSQCVESFLDLSLPVKADKPQPPVKRRKSNNNESFDVCGNVSEAQPSKHQLKKEKARKERKRQKGCASASEQSSNAKENADTKNSVESGKDGKMVCTNSTKQILVKTPPAVLILHLNRFQVQRTKFHKLTHHVSFPAVLDLTPICSANCKESLMMKPRQNQVLYALYGVVEHSGMLHTGHYVAYVKVRAPIQHKDPRWSFLPSDHQMPHKMADEDRVGTAEAPAGKWYLTSNSHITEVGEEQVLCSQAYLLFYERIW